jgi:hypothetical protein
MADEHYVKVTLPSALGMTVASMCTRCGVLVADDPEDIPEGQITPSRGHQMFHEALDHVATVLATGRADG